MSDPRDDLAALIRDIIYHADIQYGFPADEAADAILAAGWRNFAVYPDETLRDCDTLLARADGGKPICVVGDRLCYWTGTEWRWAE